VSATAALAALAAVAAVLGAWEALAAVERARAWRALLRALAPLRRAEREGREPTLPERRRLALLGAGALCAGGWLLAGAAGALLAGCAGPWLAARAVRSRQRRWRARVAREAPVVALALADALDGGHAVGAAVAEAARGVPGPAGAELRLAAASLALGEPVDAVLERVRRRAGSRPYDAIVAALLLQRDAGGPLATLLREVAAGLETAAQAEADARAATAQARFTALLVALLPVAAAGLAELGRPGVLAGLLRTPLTAWLGACSLGLQLLALAAVHRLARVRA